MALRTLDVGDFVSPKRRARMEAGAPLPPRPPSGHAERGAPQLGSPRHGVMARAPGRDSARPPWNTTALP